ncbi:MAG: hypothetical protein WDO06_02270 [Actinomycetota bacterium]
MSKANDGQVRIIHEDISSALTGVKADIVVANPPYIPNNQSLPQDVELFEPHFALFGGPTGMEIPTKFIAAGSRLLKSGGLFFDGAWRRARRSDSRFTGSRF